MKEDLTSVAFTGWSEVEKPTAKSFKELKAMDEQLRERVLDLLRRYVILQPPLNHQDVCSSILGGKSKRLVVSSLSDAEELIVSLESLGAKASLAEVDGATRCSECGGYAVVSIGQPPIGFEARKCKLCSFIIRSSPKSCCNGQGILNLYESKVSGIRWYQCDECDSMWSLDFSVIPWELRPYKDFKEVRRIVDRIQ
ncbi:hypothetical protein [Cerasicoccus frondis]|uniref:hypothetical protein n=1 Tax=Cerasicoccus frondis TaxID=490090 RepID=UPI00285269E7|nr:hypothetical protein [Cerasicoccus frondis]